MTERPTSRRLRILAFDPSLMTRLATAAINEITVEVPWEETWSPGRSANTSRWSTCDPASGVLLSPGESRRRVSAGPGRPRPVGIRSAVPSADGLCGGDDHHPPLRARAGPRRAVGRSSDRARAGGDYGEQFVRRLRIYPHALRDRNAYYSPAKKALLFGYFPVTDQGRRQHAGHAGVHLPVARHRRARDDPRAARRRAPALQRAEQSGRASRSTRRSPTSSRCSSISPIRRCCESQIRADAAATCTAKACWANSRSSSGGPPGAARRCATRSAARTKTPASGSRGSPIRTRSTDSRGRTSAAPFWSPRCSAPSS